MHHEAQAGFPALLVFVLSIVIFHGSIYLVVALNAGWRFGYWITGATMGGLMLFLSIFWLTNALGPRGEEPLWFPVAAAETPVTQATFGGDSYTTPGYPEGDWRAPAVTRAGETDPDDPLAPEVDAITASASNCVAFTEKKISDEVKPVLEKMDGPTRTILEGKFGKKDRMQRELEVCERVTNEFTLSTQDPRVPKVDGQAVAVVYDVTEYRFIEQQGTLLGQVTVVPNTYDRRVTNDPEGLTPLKVGDEFRIMAYRDPGSLRYPAYVYTVLSALWFAFHLWGLNRAERKKLSPIAA